MARPGLTSLLVVVGLLAMAGCGEGSKRVSPPPFQHFVSRPDLRPPTVELSSPSGDVAPGFLFLAPKRKVAQAGPMILDNRGQVVWFRPLDTRGVADFRVQRYGGRSVLTWWRGKAEKGVGDGYYVIADSLYHQITTVRAGNGLTGDIHEFLITPSGTALMTIYNRVPRDLSTAGGAKDGAVWEGVVQEQEIATGRVLFEWHSAREVGLTESYEKLTRGRGTRKHPYDYFHVNSVEIDKGGNLLVSARNTHALYKISRSEGRILWRMGGRRSDFTMGRGTRFAWQHDARRQPDGTITLFDNEAAPRVGKQSRVIVLRVDEQSRKVALVRSYTHTPPLLAGSQGNAQFLADGHVLIGWGAKPYVTELDRAGRVLLDARFGRGSDSYRAFRFPWVGTPADDPAVALRADADGRVTVYASWNGATEVARWQVLAGPDPQHLRSVAVARRSGFETAVRVRTSALFFRARALSGAGIVLGTSGPIKLVESDS